MGSIDACYNDQVKPAPALKLGKRPGRGWKSRVKNAVADDAGGSEGKEDGERDLTMDSV